MPHPKHFAIPKLSLPQLVSISAIEEFGTVVCAAQHLHITPSAITHRIREAERKLDTQIIAHCGNQVVLTKAGLHIAALSKKVISDLLKIETEVEQINESSLRIGITSEAMFRWIINLPKFNSHTKNTKLNVLFIDIESANDSLLNGEIDILISTSSISGKNIDCQTISTDILQLIVPSSDIWYLRRDITADDLNNRFGITNQDLDELTLRGKSSILIDKMNLYYSCSSIEALLDILLIEGGIGITFSSEKQLDIINSEFKTFHLDNDQYKRNWNIMRNIEDCSSCTATFFQSIINGELETIK